LENAKTLEDINNLRIYHLHSLQGKRKGQYALDLGRKLGFRLIIIPVDDNNKPISVSNEVLCAKAVLVLEVTNHYE